MPPFTARLPIRMRDASIAFVLGVCASLGVLSATRSAWAVVPLLLWAIVAPFSRWRWPTAAVLTAFVLLGMRAFSTNLTVAVIVVGVFTAYIIRRNVRPVLRDFAAIALVTGDLVALSLVSPVPRSMPFEQQLPYLAWSATLLVAAGLFGELRRRTEEAATRELEQALRQQRIELQQAMSEQRAFLAREIHDVVTHSLTVIVAQADGGRYGGDCDKALRVIGEVGRESLAQMREVVALLRAPESRSVEPSPVSLDFEELVRTSRLGGLDITYSQTGSAPEQLPLATSLAARRVVQEALTNALKHGDGAALLDVTWEEKQVVIRVNNGFDGTAASLVNGHGLRGMRERAALIGATLQAGPTPTNSGRAEWVTQVRIPYVEQGLAGVIHPDTLEHA